MVFTLMPVSLFGQGSAQDTDVGCKTDRQPRGTLRCTYAQTLKFRAKSSIILNRLDEFQRQLLERMSGVKPPAAPVAATATAVANTAEKAVNAVADKASAPTSKSSKKKKGKKK